MQGLIRTVKDAPERRLNTRTRSSGPISAWMVEWSEGLITRYVKGQTGRTAYREARGPDASTSRSVWEEDHVHDVRQERAKGRCEVPRRNVVATEKEGGRVNLEKC